MTVTPEFSKWLRTTSFAGRVNAGDKWDTAEAWPSAESMKAARDCFNAFERGEKKQAEEFMHSAQAGMV